MRIPSLRWTDWNEEHLARHGVEPSEVDEVVAADEFHMVRVRGGRYALIGQTNAGRYLTVIVERELTMGTSSSPRAPRIPARDASTPATVAYRGSR